MPGDCPTCRAIRTLVVADLPPAPPAEGPRYLTRSTAPVGVTGRTWDAMVRDLTPLGRVFKPGREILVRSDHVAEWIESHPVQCAEPAPIEADEEDDAPIPIERFRRRRGR